jgi:hypothetical protein
MQRGGLAKGGGGAFTIDVSPAANASVHPFWFRHLPSILSVDSTFIVRTHDFGAVGFRLSAKFPDQFRRFVAGVIP